MLLRDYQSLLKADIYAAWTRGARNVVGVLPTGGGKTPVFSHLLLENDGASCAIAHRQELVSQMSLTLARNDVPHRIVGPSNVIREIVRQHTTECGMSYYSPSAKVGAAGVDTLLRRAHMVTSWLNSCGLWVIDEGHHLLSDNKWGKAVDLFPRARGLGVTATPLRADGKGLGRHADGLYDDMIIGPTMRELIDRGYLTDYRIFNPPSDLNLDGVAVSSTTGDYNPNQLKQRVRQSHLVGDVVSHYLRLAAGKLGVTFVTDVETATEEAERFKAAGVPAAVVSAKTPDSERASLLRDFRARRLLQLVNVDLFGEGFDLPALEVVSMARPTESFGLYSQQFGRALRPMDGKEKALIIDHVGNVTRHGLPDAPRIWTLDRRERGARSKRDPDVMPVRTCPACTGVYEAFYVACPYCGHKPQPEARNRPDFVDGDLQELDAETLAAMRGAKAAVDVDAATRERQLKAAGFVGPQLYGALKQHAARQEAQQTLRATLVQWAERRLAEGRSLAECHRIFYFQFGTDVLTAQALGRPDAEALTDRVRRRL